MLEYAAVVGRLWLVALSRGARSPGRFTRHRLSTIRAGRVFHVEPARRSRSTCKRPGSAAGVASPYRLSRPTGVGARDRCFAPAIRGKYDRRSPAWRSALPLRLAPLYTRGRAGPARAPSSSGASMNNDDVLAALVDRAGSRAAAQRRRARHGPRHRDRRRPPVGAARADHRGLPAEGSHRDRDRAGARGHRRRPPGRGRDGRHVARGVRAPRGRRQGRRRGSRQRRSGRAPGPVSWRWPAARAASASRP